MTQPIGSGFRPYEHPISDTEQAALDYCRKADSVTSGYLCDEPKVISDACRKPSHALDELLCDDQRMKQAQDGALSLAWDALKNLKKLLLGGT